MKNIWNYVGLHFAVLSWGLAGVAANLMTLSAVGIVVYRSLIAFVILFILHLFIKFNQIISYKDRIFMLITGMMIGLHWWGFFTAIKVSTVSITLICISSAPVFVALLQPLIDKKPFKINQVFLGVISLIGIYIMFKFESEYKLGIMIGLSAGAVDAVMTARTKENIPSGVVTKYHMFGAFMVVLFIYTIIERNFNWLELTTKIDYFGALLLVSCVIVDGFINRKNNNNKILIGTS